jgi:hypothetical protein
VREIYTRRRVVVHKKYIKCTKEINKDRQAKTEKGNVVKI